jgi:hypothetical protein
MCHWQTIEAYDEHGNVLDTSAVQPFALSLFDSIHQGTPFSKRCNNIIEWFEHTNNAQLCMHRALVVEETNSLSSTVERSVVDINPGVSKELY